jgi:hypothetical protein
LLENGGNIELASSNAQNLQLVIKNIGEGNFEFTGNPLPVIISGDDVLKVSSQPISNSLMYGESGSFEIQYNPVSGNEYISTLEIPFSGDNLYSFEFLSNSFQAPFNALEFNPFILGNDYFEILNSDSLNFIDNFSIEFWAINYSVNNLQTIISKAEPSIGGFAVGTENAFPVFEVWDSLGNHHKITGQQLLNQHRWYHFALVFENGVLKGYINSTKIGEIDTDARLGTTPNKLIAGKSSWDIASINQFSGMIDEIRIWDKALSEIEMSENMDNEISGDENDLAVYHNGNLNTSGRIFDNAGFDNNGIVRELASWWKSNALIVPKIAKASNITNSGFIANWQTTETGVVNEYLLDVSESVDFATFLPGYNARKINGISDTIENLTAGTNYFYRVRANIYDADFDAEVGAFSKSSQVTTINDCDLPEKPETPAGETMFCKDPENMIYTVAEVQNAESYQWIISPSNAGTTTSTTNSAEIDFTNDFSGDIKIAVIGNNFCGNGEISDSLEVTISICTKIDDLNNINPITIYPNPSEGKFTIFFKDNSIKYYHVINSLGQVIQKKQVHKNVEQVEWLDQGIYLLCFYNEKIIISKQVIIIQ